MAGIPRPAAVAPKSSMQRVPLARPGSSRSHSMAPPATRSGAVSPADSIASAATTATTGTKRKHREMEHEGSDETNINVVVRCRGRNEREVKENSGVVLSTNGVRGNTVELSMGPSALSNKTYHFDKVFSPAADQAMIYDDVVQPIIDEMLAGFNCTIFAYGQTGTGKTYTMSGDMHSTLGLLSDAAGIIPRALHGLFKKLEQDEAESSVKCSFIELYNEELRDLISTDDNSKLKIYEDTGKKSGTFVQGMEESHIKSAEDGVKLLQKGSHKRQVAATKCNDLSSRSHTVFTVTAFIKRQGDNGEDYISAGKLNLVDLAGSENIQRSGAENKRAAEAGLINRSLLTLGRVINALVERSDHIPYRESKLTRLLQDSLGGRTKTCIIATVSPAKSNLEETISTLDYAFRAKNIKNKPQINQMINKKTLLREFTAEIEKLKSELIATRQRNGVYLTAETYEEMTVESESRRILAEEQAAKIETMETNLRNKVQELYSCTLNFMNLKKDHEGQRVVLDETKTVLEQTEFVLGDTKQKLADEEVLRRAHERTEEQLSSVGNELLSTLGRTVGDVDGLHSKLRRRSDLQSLNRNTWGLSQAQVSEVTSLVESRVDEFRHQQEGLMASVTSRMQAFVQEELEKLSSTQQFLQENVASFEASERDVSQQNAQAKDEMDTVLEEIKTLREEVKTRVGEGLQGLSAAAERISGEVINELGAFHTQLHSSYSSLGKDFKNLFEELIKHVNAQKAEADELRKKLVEAEHWAIQDNLETSKRLDRIRNEELEQGAQDRTRLLKQIGDLIFDQGAEQDRRWESKIKAVHEGIVAGNERFETARAQYSSGMDAWNDKEAHLVGEVLRSRETLKSKLKEDWVAANKHNATLQTATKSVHEETIRIVDEQMKDISHQMRALDEFVTRARSQNAQHHEIHSNSLNELVATVRNSYSNIGAHFVDSYDRVKFLGDEMTEKTASISLELGTLDPILRQPLAELRTAIGATVLQEYVPTGETPQKVQYAYPTTLPRTQPHEQLLAALRRPAGAEAIPSPTKTTTVPVVFNDSPALEQRLVTPTMSTDGDNGSVTEITPTLIPTLRELDRNISSLPIASSTEMVIDQSAKLVAASNSIPLFKRSVSGIRPPASSAGKGLKRATVGGGIVGEGRENVAPELNLGRSVGPGGGGRRRSPRMAGGS